MSVGSFLVLLSVYLSSTVIGWKGVVFTQRSGVCIGSRVAPVLSEIFLSSFDRDLQMTLDGIVVKMFQYVDDYLRVGKFQRLCGFARECAENF